MQLHPYGDVRVIDFTQVLAGPYLARVLAEFGADVIKVESPAGDLSRQIAPRSDRGMSGLYTWVNLGKRNVCIDLQTPEGHELALGLVKRADAVIENFRPGVAERLGIGWDAIHRANPRAVLVSISGYGSDSSLGDHGAFAPTMHAATGLLEYQARKSGAAPRPLQDAHADLVTALHATIGLLAALRAAERTGEGEHLEVAMYDAVLATHSETPFELLDPPELRLDSPIFDAGRHGCIAVAGPPQHVWARARDAFGIEDPTPAGADLETKARLRHEALERWMGSHEDRDELLRILEDANLPCAPIRSLREALEGPFARERGLLVEVDDRRGGTRRIPRLPYRFSRSSLRAARPAPRRGEHNAQVLGQLLGIPQQKLQALEAQGILQSDNQGDTTKGTSQLPDN
jgi:crotonobetainyl-CoA:carnitine CoA-transferase CaiB-like acyl-CoA transferase